MGTPAPEVLRSALDRWLAAQREAAELVVHADHPGTPTDWAEGFRWVTRIASLALDYVVEKADPLRPVIFRSQDEHRKLLVDNPDVNYYFCVLDPRETYRLRGKRGGAPYLGFTLGTDIFRPSAGGRTGTLSQTYADQFPRDAEGNFEILLSAEKHAGSWIQLAPEVQHLAVRETFHDRRREQPAELHVERLGPLHPVDLTPELFARQLDAAGAFLLFIVRTGIAMWAGGAARMNELIGASGAQHVAAQDDQVRSHSDTDMVYMGGRFQLEPGQALRIRIAPPPYEFVYWGIVLVNPWMESYDYTQRHVNTNDHLAARSPDGSWTLVISPEDPGVPNWLDTGGRRDGFMLLRWVLAGDRPPTPRCELVPLATLRRA